MRNLRTIGCEEFEALVANLEKKPYLIVVANKTTAKRLLSTDGVQALDEFNQKEIMKERTPVFILSEPAAFKPSWKGFMWVFTVQSTRELNPSIPEMVQVRRVSFP
jgi:hypothetical protein